MDGLRPLSNRLLTVKQAATMLGVTALTLRNWDNSGKLEASRHPFNNYRVYRREDIEKLLTEISTNKENCFLKSYYLSHCFLLIKNAMLIVYFQHI
ncbi:MAG: MerR family transcriptional regulator [Patescibacteria group bacterium]